MSETEQRDPIKILATTLSNAILTGDRALLDVIKALMHKVELLESRVEQLEYLQFTPRDTDSDRIQ